MSRVRVLMLGGLWRNNPALVQLLGLCPLLAVTTTLVNGLTLGLATLVVVAATNTIVSMMRHSLVAVVRIPLFVLIIASIVTCIDLLTHALLFELHEILGLFIPLIITNCAILAQAETVASRRPVNESLVSGIATGLGFCGVLVVCSARSGKSSVKAPCWRVSICWSARGPQISGSICRSTACSSPCCRRARSSASQS